VIKYSLRCENSHEFEDWFRSGAAFDEEAAAGDLVCPECKSHRIEKAPMAPAVSGTKGIKAGGCPMAESACDAPPCGGACGCFPG
jgi:hypothetical protein